MPVYPGALRFADLRELVGSERTLTSRRFPLSAELSYRSQNNLVTMTLTGAQLKTLLEEHFQGCALDFPQGIGPPRFNHILQVSEGFTYSWNPAGATCNKVDAGSIKVNGVTIDPTRKHRVTVSSYLAEGGDRLYEFTHGIERVDGAQDVDSLARISHQERATEQAYM